MVTALITASAPSSTKSVTTSGLLLASLDIPCANPTDAIPSVVTAASSDALAACPN